MSQNNDCADKTPKTRVIDITLVGKDYVVREGGCEPDKMLCYGDTMDFQLDPKHFTKNAAIEEILFFAFPQHKKAMSKSLGKWQKTPSPRPGPTDNLPLDLQANHAKPGGAAIRNVNSFSALNVVVHYAIKIQDGSDTHWVDPELHIVKQGQPIIGP